VEPSEPLSLSRHPDGAILFVLSETLDWVALYSRSAYPYQDDALFRNTTSLISSRSRSGKPTHYAARDGEGCPNVLGNRMVRGCQGNIAKLGGVVGSWRARFMGVILREGWKLILTAAVVFVWRRSGFCFVRPRCRSEVRAANTGPNPPAGSGIPRRTWKNAKAHHTCPRRLPCEHLCCFCLCSAVFRNLRHSEMETELSGRMRRGAQPFGREKPWYVIVTWSIPTHGPLVAC